MSQRLPVNGFRWIKTLSRFNADNIKNQNSDKGYTLEDGVDYFEHLHNLHDDLPFVPDRMKINKCQKLVCNICNKDKYVIHIKALRKALNHGIIFKIGIEKLNLIKMYS